MAFGSVIAGTAILGAVGALLALPVSATLQGFISSYAARYHVEVDVNTGGLPMDLLAEEITLAEEIQEQGLESSAIEVGDDGPDT